MESAQSKYLHIYKNFFYYMVLWDMFINKTLVFQQSLGIPLLLSTLPLASQPSRDTARPACFVRHPRRHKQLP